MLIVKSFELFKTLLSELKNDKNLKILGYFEETYIGAFVFGNSKPENNVLTIKLCICSSISTFVYFDNIPLTDEEKIKTAKEFLNTLKIIRAEITAKNNNFELS